MIKLEDCITLSDLSETQVLAIAEHEHLPEIAAAALAQYLSKQERGMEKIRDMIVDDSGGLNSARTRRSCSTPHPEVCPPQHPWSKLY